MSLSRIKVFLATITLIFIGAPGTTIVSAFSIEIFNQVLVQLGTVTEYYGQVCPDELAFAAANLLDANQKRRNLIPPLIPSSSPPSTGDDDDNTDDDDERGGIGIQSIQSIIPSGSSILQLQKLLTPNTISIYDYEDNGSSSLTQSSSSLSSSSILTSSQTSQSVPSILDLTPAEETLIQLIWAVRNKYSPRTTIRIAGGWVRDKLIYGKETPSRDVDLVLSDISGREFAEFVGRYVEEENERTLKKGNDDGMDHHREDDDDGEEDNGMVSKNDIISIEQPNDNKGHAADALQTASLLINNFEVDFCRLRYEKYSKHSRIPVSTRIATVVEDAWRRDLTINCLYYNLGSNQVEDFTECGIRDLILQQIDTPKAPLKTLLEDPTRILRAIRFAAQLSFDISLELLSAARDDRVREALRGKVSRDAIGKSIDEMLGTRARDPCRGIQLLMATNLIDVVFPLGDDGEYNCGNDDDAAMLYNVGLEYLSRTQSLVTRIFVSSPELEWDIGKRRFLWYAAFLKPVYELMPAGGDSNKKRKQESSFYRLLDVSLKRPKVDVQSIESILKGVEPIQKMILEEVNDNTDAIQSAIQSGARLADVSPQSSQWKDLSDQRWRMYSTLKPIGAMWKEALILAFALSRKDIQDCVDKYKDLIILIEDQLQLKSILLEKSNKPTPLLNGSEIRQRALRGHIDGRGFRRVMEAMEEWQIRNIICHDFQGVDDDDERNRTETQLIDYLVTAFPEYASDTMSR